MGVSINTGSWRRLGQRGGSHEGNRNALEALRGIGAVLDLSGKLAAGRINIFTAASPHERLRTMLLKNPLVQGDCFF